MEQIQKFYAYLEELDQNYSRLADLLRQKLEAVAKNDLAKIDSLMKEEQVYALLSRGFDQNLAAHREKLGLRGETLAEVIEELPEETRTSFRELYKRLKTVLDEVRALNKRCQDSIEDRLYTLDRRIRELDKSAAPTYGKTGDAAPTGQPGMFTKSV